jgi:hypothetical protein
LISLFRNNRSENKLSGKIDFKVIEVKEIGKERDGVKAEGY